MSAAKKTLRIIQGLLLVAIIAVGGFFGIYYYQLANAPEIIEEVVQEPPQRTYLEIPAGSDLPVGKLIITPARETYEDDQIRLIISSLEIDTMIKNGTELSTLKTGPGLYEYAQLPDEAGANVSIAGHRDVHGNIFYYLDKLAAGA